MDNKFYNDVIECFDLKGQNLGTFSIKYEETSHLYFEKYDNTLYFLPIIDEFDFKDGEILEYILYKNKKFFNITISPDDFDGERLIYKYY